MSIEIVNGRVFIEGKETVNPELIGYAVLDYAENGNYFIHSDSEIKDMIVKIHDSSFNAGQIGVNCIGIPVFYSHYLIAGIRQKVTKTKYF